MTCPPYHTDPPTMPNINGILIRRDDNWTLLALGHHDGPAIEAAGAKLPLHEGHAAVDSTEWTIEHLWAVRKPKCDCPPPEQTHGACCGDLAVCLRHDHNPDPDHSVIDVGELWGYYTAATPGAFPVTRATAWSLLLPPLPAELLARLPLEF